MKEASGGRHNGEDEKTRSMRIVGAIKLKDSDENTRSFAFGSKESLVYPSLIVYYPFLPQPIQSLAATRVGDKP